VALHVLQLEAEWEVDEDPPDSENIDSVRSSSREEQCGQTSSSSSSDE